jgi:hypothetical protein
MGNLCPNSNSKTVWIYIDPSKPIGDPEQLTVFATPEAAEKWFRDHGYPEGLTLKRKVIE